MVTDLLLPLDLLARGQWADVVDVAGEPNHVCRLAELLGWPQPEISRDVP